MAEQSCMGCDAGRREFIRTSLAAIAGVAAALGLGAEQAAALTARVGTASSVTGDQATYPIPATDGVTIDRDRQVILARAQGAVYAFALSCPHQNTALRWDAHDDRFQCPKHKSRYAPDGTFQSGRATRNMDRFALRRDGGNVIVDLDTLFRSDHDAAAWTAALVRV
jgi:nitrite reductase/ring-hydroxylating ferredoxin subunit